MKYKKTFINPTVGKLAICMVHLAKVFCLIGKYLRTEKAKREAQDLMYLQTASLDRIEHEKFLQQVFTVCGHVEGNTVLPS